MARPAKKTKKARGLSSLIEKVKTATTIKGNPIKSFLSIKLNLS
jgi:hypothetical protein